MKNSEIVRLQFNRQADQFDKWSVPKNVEYMKGIAKIISFNSEDTLLDVATGTGDFPIFIAPEIKRAVGVDISESMIHRATQKGNQHGLSNTEFRAMDAEKLPFSDSSFTVVNSKSAFHHMSEYKTVFSEMVRCCKPDGKIIICDIVAFECPKTDAFFEKIEKAVDSSHYRTLRIDEFKNLYDSNGITIEKLVEIEIEHSLSEYLSHAVQTKDALIDLRKLVAEAKEVDYLRKYWTFEDDPNFRKKVILILGIKKE
jgi:ubiquinone/menaquinone biosynthesis C-methylase UbiE